MKKVIEQEGKDAIRIEEGLVFDGIKISQHMRGVIYIEKSKAREVALAICPELGEPTIKSVTNCPTCGAECEVHGNTTHYYVPKSTLQLRRIEALEKDKEIEMFAIGLHEWLHEEGYEWGNKPHQMYRGGKYFWTKDLIELYKQSLNK